ncbi:MAG: hypothetical protein IJB96_03380 [Lachnospira sp.]|nr:hypothetical protein [Lachnospira sp.]
MDSYLGGVNSVYSNSVYTGTDNSLENKINNSDLTTATDEELMEVCKDFEAYFTEQIMKAMIKMSDVDGDTENNNIYSTMFGMSDVSDAGMNTLSSYFGDEMVTKMAKQATEAQGGQGLGIAQILYEQMKRNYGIPSVDESVDEPAEDVVTPVVSL